MSRLSEKNEFSILELASISGHKTLQMLKSTLTCKLKNWRKKWDSRLVLADVERRKADNALSQE